MSGDATASDSRGNLAALWWGWIAAPFWWLAQFEARYALVPWACHHGHRWVVLYLGLAALIGSVALIACAGRSDRKCTRDPPSSFLVRGGIWIAAFFALLVLVQMLPDVF